MSPSRGCVGRLLLRGLEGRAQRPFGCAVPPSRHRLGLHTLPLDFTRSFSPTTSVASTNASTNGEPALSSRLDDSGGGGADASLFESSSSEYEEQAAALTPEHHALHSSPSQLLASLLAKSTREATTTLRDLKRLETVLQGDYAYARPARHCAVGGDYQGCLSWLDVLPNHYSTGDEKLAREGEQACEHVAAALTALVNGNAEPYIVYLALLKVTSKGYLEAGERTNSAIYQALTWLVRHGRVLVDHQEDQEWSWQLWKSLVQACVGAKSKNAPSTSRLTRYEDAGLDASLAHALNRLYNGSIRALALSGRYVAALHWIRQSDSFASVDCRGAITHLHPFTWRIYLEEALDLDSPATESVRTQTEGLISALQRLTADAKAPNDAQRLMREVQGIVPGRDASDALASQPLDDLVLDRLDRGDSKGAIDLLQQALSSSSSQWSHLPKATTLVAVREAVSTNEQNAQGDALQAYLDNLQGARGAKGLYPLSTMMLLFSHRRHVECVQFFLSVYRSRDVAPLAAIVDERTFPAQEDKGSGKLRDSTHASYLALKSLVALCQHDFFTMQKVYRSWLQRTAQHMHGRGEALGSALEGDEVEARPTEDIFEDINLDYLFSPEAGTLDKETLSPMAYQSAPNARPTVFYFNLFLKALPKAMNWSAHRGSSSVRALLQSDNLPQRTVNSAFDILRDMQNFQVVPNASTWSILLTILARNISRPEEVEGGAGKDETGWSQIWTMTSSLGMGDLAKQKSDLPLPKATPLTYANLIYAFLMVPPSRGGPLLEEARTVKRWLEEDEEALVDVRRYQQPLDRVMQLLAKVEARQEALTDHRGMTSEGTCA